MYSYEKLFNVAVTASPFARTMLHYFFDHEHSELNIMKKNETNLPYSNFYCYNVGIFCHHLDDLQNFKSYLDLLDEIYIKKITSIDISLEVYQHKYKLIKDFNHVQHDMIMLGWNGEYSYEPHIFTIVDNSGNELSYGFIWKENNDNSIFIASKFELVWIEQKDIISRLCPDTVQ
jgi:hypothetical protein